MDTNGHHPIPSMEDLAAQGILIPEVPTQRKRTPKKSAGDLFLEAVQAAAVNREEIAAIIEERIATLAPRRVVVELKPAPTAAPKELTGAHHYLTPLMAKVIGAGLNLLMTGPSGTGKTTAAIKIAEALGRSVYLVTCSPVTSKADILGFIDAGGGYREPAFISAMRSGGLLILDELDCLHPGMAVILNGAIGNRMVTLPSGETLKAHPDFSVVGCANTLGLGATAEYVGRNRLDAATLNRFVYLHVPLDASLEASFAGIEEAATVCNLEEGGIPSPADCLNRIREIRAAIDREKLPFLLTPRDLEAAVKLAHHGIGSAWIDRMVYARQATALQAERLGIKL